MSYKKYVNYKNNIKVNIDLNQYKDHINNLINKKIEEKSKIIEVICNHEVARLIEQTEYPQAEVLKLALFTKNPKKINSKIENMKEWISKRTNFKFNDLVNLIETACYLDICENNKEKILSMYESFYYKKMILLSNKIEESIKNIKWKNYNIDIKGEIIKEEFIIENANLYVNEIKSLKISLEDYGKCHHIEESIYYKECLELSKEINKSFKKIGTFYIDASVNSKNIIESLKKEMNINLKGFLPEGAVLTKTPKENSWKIRINEENLIPLEDSYIVGQEGVCVRHIEKL